MRRAALLVALLALAGCTADRAAGLAAAAAQFDAEAQAAVRAIGDLAAAEVAPAPRTEAEALAEFVRILEALPADEALGAEDVALALDPWTAADGEAAGRRRAFVARVSAQYEALRRATDGLGNLGDIGAFAARKAVRRIEDPARRLAAQLTAFAEVYAATPPRFVAAPGCRLTSSRPTRRPDGRAAA